MVYVRYVLQLNYKCLLISPALITKSNYYNSINYSTKNITSRAIVNDTLEGPASAYEMQIQQGELKEDNHQRKIVEHFQEVFDGLQSYEPSLPSIFDKIFSRKRTDSVPKGLYLYGAVGGGKTVLMDLFFSCCKVCLVCFFLLFMPFWLVGSSNFSYFYLLAHSKKKESSFSFFYAWRTFKNSWTKEIN